jgi:hypothetical protein
LKAFGGLVEEKFEPNDSVMEGVTVRPIDTEDLRASGSFQEIGDVVFGKLLAQVEPDHVKLGCITHVRISTFPDISCLKSRHGGPPIRRSR